jgi:hypothetical protein
LEKPSKHPGQCNFRCKKLTEYRDYFLPWGLHSVRDGNN